MRKISMQVRQKLLFSCLASVILFFMAGCGPKTPPSVEKIILGTEAITLASPIWIAADKGYFQEEGLQVEIKTFSSGKATFQALLNDHSIDLATAAQTPLVYNSFQNRDYAIIGRIVNSDNEVKILARQDKGLKTPGDLKGKKIGITLGTSSHFFLGLFLLNYHLRMADVKMIDLEQTHLSEALIQGQVDAIVTWEPFSFLARKALGEKAMLFPSQGLYRLDYYLIARNDFIKNHPEVLRRFLRAVEKGEVFIKKNENEAIDILCTKLKIDREATRANWHDLRFRMSLDQSILVSLEDHARWAILNKIMDVETIPNYLAYIYPEALRAIKPEAITIAGE
jgi:NitT/TauT family transport system substrate-binding protein